MSSSLDDKHLVELDHPSILESIDEVFDGITSLLTDNALMYGSTVTAILAGLPILGDLDVAISGLEYRNMTQILANSVKWVQEDGRPIPEKSDRFRLPTGKKNPYAEDKHLPITNVVSFRTVNDSCVQLMESKVETGDPLEDALDIVRKVDFAFCGVCVDKWGRLLETIPHGYSDCQGRLIRIVDYQARLDTERLKERVHKYVKRGWNLTFSIDQAILNINRNRAAIKPPPKKKPFKKPAGLFRVRKDVRKGVMLELKSDVVRMTGQKSPDKCIEVVLHFGRDNNVHLSFAKTAGSVVFWSKGKNLETKYQNIIKQCSSYFDRNYGVSPKSLAAYKKKSKLKASWNGEPVSAKSYEGYASPSVGYATYSSDTSTSTSKW